MHLRLALHGFLFAWTFTAAALPLRAQNLLVNGDFSQGLSAWTESGTGVSSAIETFDVDGFGASASFAVNASNGAHVLTQVVPIPQGLVYELYADVAIDAPGFNNDTGVFELRVDGVAIDRFDFGGTTGARVARTALAGLFTSANPTTTIEIAAIRGFGGLLGRTPRQRIDNLRLEFCPGPSAFVRRERWSQSPLGTPSLEVRGAPGSPFTTFVAPALLQQPLVIPPLSGQLELSPLGLFGFIDGALDVQGRFTLFLTVPSDPFLVRVPIHLQAIGTGVANVLGFGVAHNVGVQR